MRDFNLGAIFLIVQFNMEGNFPSEVARAVTYCYSRQCFRIFLFCNYIFKIGQNKGFKIDTQ